MWKINDSCLFTISSVASGPALRTKVDDVTTLLLAIFRYGTAEKGKPGYISPHLTPYTNIYVPYIVIVNRFDIFYTNLEVSGRYRCIYKTVRGLKMCRCCSQEFIMIIVLTLEGGHHA